LHTNFQYIFKKTHHCLECVLSKSRDKFLWSVSILFKFLTISVSLCADLLDYTESDAELEPENVADSQRLLEEEEADATDYMDTTTDTGDPTGTSTTDEGMAHLQQDPAGNEGLIPRPTTPFGKTEIGPSAPAAGAGERGLFPLAPAAPALVERGSSPTHNIQQVERVTSPTHSNNRWRG
jgi:hypothetical protein